SLSVDEPSSLSAHVEKPGSSANNRLSGARRFGLGVKNGVGERACRVKLASGENRLVSSPLTRSTHTPGPPTMEWLGPRTVKAFAAAGLFDGEREEAGAGFEREKAGSTRVNRFEPDRAGASSVLSRFDREGATSVMSRLDRDRETSLGFYDRDRDYSTINRYASLRDHAPSRAAFSEAASTSSFGTRSACTTGNAGAGWSPSPTFSSAARTAFSGSTAPTSVSSGVGSGIGAGAGVGVGNGIGADVRTLQEKHCLETSALLNALADSQEACRRLREENGMLRERLRVLEATAIQDRDDVGLGRGIGLVCLAKTRKMGPIKHIAATKTSSACPENTSLLSVSPLLINPECSHLSLVCLISNDRTRISCSMTDTVLYPLRRLSISRPDGPPPRRGPRSSDLLLHSRHSPNLHLHCPFNLLFPAEKTSAEQRRASTSSSLFPAPPPEMSMLMLEDVGLSNVVSESPPSPGGSSPLLKNWGINIRIRIQ
ncbi:hypothetical protein F4604DRAFT_1991293, partial [Suillus subluteus]